MLRFLGQHHTGQGEADGLAGGDEIGQQPGEVRPGVAGVGGVAQDGQAGDGRHGEIVLGRVAQVHRGLRDPGGGGDRPDSHSPVAALGQELGGGIEDGRVDLRLAGPSPFYFCSH